MRCIGTMNIESVVSRRRWPARRGEHRRNRVRTPERLYLVWRLGRTRSRQLRYKEYLRRYIDDARAISASPLLVTPMCRRIFGPDGRLTDALGPYANAMKEVAAE